MEKRAFTDCLPYEAAKHFKMVAFRLQGKEETGIQNFWVGISHFLPGGGAEYDKSSTDKVYFVLEGEVTVIGDDQQKIVLKQWDSIYIPPEVGRSVINETNKPASMMVIMNYPKA